MISLEMYLSISLPEEPVVDDLAGLELWVDVEDHQWKCLQPAAPSTSSTFQGVPVESDECQSIIEGIYIRVETSRQVQQLTVKIAEGPN